MIARPGNSRGLLAGPPTHLASSQKVGSSNGDTVTFSLRDRNPFPPRLIAVMKARSDGFEYDHGDFSVCLRLVLVVVWPLLRCELPEMLTLFATCGTGAGRDNLIFHL
jgi:hypothetical protein